MTIKTKICAVATMMLATAQSVSAQLVINELMQSNTECVMDDMREYPDSWVEVRNVGDVVDDLAMYCIGITDDPEKAWPLPDELIFPGGFAIIYCDKAAVGKHTDFRLESGKNGAVYLFRAGKIVDKITGLKKMPSPNISYGRSAKDLELWGYMQTPTPLSPNSSIASDILGEPVFSLKGQVFKNVKAPLGLVLSLPEGASRNTQIRYTLDGSEPKADSPLYKEPIVIKSNTVVRARLMRDGLASPVSTVHSYIFLDHNQTLPIVSLATNPKNLYDNQIGIYVEGVDPENKKNWEYDWRRPVNIEMFETDGKTLALNQLCEMRIQGGASRGCALKSLALYAHKRFGEKQFAYEFFPDQRPGQKNFKSLILRNAGNDFDYLYMRDAIMQRTMAANTDVDWQAWRPVMVYINGEYKGIENIRERSNEDNIYTNYDGLEDIDMVENYWELKQGTWDNYDAFKAFYSEPGHKYAEYEKLMDIKEYINLMAANIFYLNLDFPGNNNVMWRPRAEGGKWRWILKDLDFGMGLYGRAVDFNMIRWLYNPNYAPDTDWANKPEHTLLFRRLMENDDFRREFIDHMAIYMGDFLNDRGTREVWDPMYDMIKTEYPIHRALFNPWWPNYDDELRNARTWVKNRANHVYKHLGEYYKLGNTALLKMNIGADNEKLQDVGIIVNGVRLTKGRLNGKFYCGRELRLSAEPGKELKVVGWELTTTDANGTTVHTKWGADHIFNMPDCTSLTIDAILGSLDGIETVTVDTPASPRKVLTNGRITIQRGDTTYDVVGRRVE